MENFLQPGRLAKTGIDAAAPILEQIGDMAGFPEVFVNIDHYRGSVHRLAGGDPLLLRAGRTAFHHADRVQTDYARRLRLDPVCTLERAPFLAGKGARQRGVVRHQGLGAGRSRRERFRPVRRVPGASRRTIHRPRAGRDAASLALLALGIFGPGIATGLVSGAPQLGAGAMAGAAVGAVGTGVAIGAAVTGVGGAVMAGARMAPAAAKLAGAGARAATSAAGSARSAFQAGSAAAGGGAKGAAAGLGNVGRTGASRRPQRHLWCFRCWAEGGRLLPRWLERQKRQRRCWPRPDRRRHRRLAEATATGLGQADAPPPAGYPCRDHCRPHAARRRRRRLRARPQRLPGFRYLTFKENTHAIQTTAGALRRYAAACHPVSSRRPGVGRPYRLRPRAGEELAPDGLRLPSARAVDGRRPGVALGAVHRDALCHRGRSSRAGARRGRGRHAVPARRRADRAPPGALRDAGSLAVHRPRGAAELARCLRLHHRQGRGGAQRLRPHQ